jgi:glycine/D-amino acid oxidase-like deaminating enzyme
VLDQTKVTEIIPIGKEGAKVVTSKGEFTCKRLIICAGPWTNHCLKPFGTLLGASSFSHGALGPSSDRLYPTAIRTLNRAGGADQDH